MYYSSARKEIIPRDADEYSDYGLPDPSFAKSDPVNSCLPGSFMDNPSVAELGLCPSFMAQRCAQKWDEKCDLYTNTIGDQVKLKNFIRDVTSRKYCQLSPDSNCSKMCQPFSPIDQTSPQVCSYVGSEVLKDANASIDIGWNYPVNISPDYMGICQQTCNLVNPSSIQADDKVINSCLKYGFCNDILINICKSAGNTQINHPGLASFCSVINPPVQSPAPVSQPVVKESLYNKPIYRREIRHHHDVIFKFIIVICVLIFICWVLYRCYKKKSGNSK